MPSIPPKKGAAALLAAVLLSGAVTAGQIWFPIHPLTNLVGMAASPFRALGSRLTGAVEGVFFAVSDYDELSRHVAELEGQIAEMEGQVRQAEEIRRENDRLRSLLGVQRRHTDLVLEPANITARSLSGWSSTLTLSKGTDHNIQTGDPVISQYGELVGIVGECGTRWATVNTVLDPGCTVSVTTSPGGTAGVLRGDFAQMGEGCTCMEDIALDGAVEPGETVCTAGSEGFPSGLEVGEVAESGIAPSGTCRFAVLTPAVDWRELEQVFVVLDFEQED